MESNEKENIPLEIKFPENLTREDIELVYKQCEIQKATSRDEILGFAEAYSEAKKLANNKDCLESFMPNDVEKLILRLGL